jgi:putative ABC transport system permease protein
MALPLYYNVRNVRIRWQVTLLAISGIALVVAVFAVLMSMSEGFRAALRSTGRDDNAIVVQRGSSSELTSGVPLEDRNTIVVDERVARGKDGQPLASWEQVVVLGLPRLRDGEPANVTLRAVTPRAFEVRGGIRIVEGRSFTPGLDEVIVGRKLPRRIRGLAIGDSVKYQHRQFKVVGLFESEGGAFESEVWGDYDTFSAIFQRTGSNSLVLRMKDKAAIPELDRFIRAQPQMQLQALSERQYYADQAGPLTRVLQGLANFVALVMGIGAVFGAINTMYAIVASRTREIGTLRALGFSRRSILVSFLVESVILALVGGVIGCLLAFPMNGFSTGTGQTQSFSEIAFEFRITPTIVVGGLVFAAVMGLLGGLLPALRGARLPITTSLREA